MNAQETLAQIDRMMTEIDLALYQWQTDLDMMSFIGYNASFAMWTDEVPPRVVTSKNIGLLPLQGIKDVRVMHFTEDGWTKVGTARINEDGNFVAKIDHDIPGLTDINTDFSLDGIGNLKPVILPAWPMNPPFEGLNQPLTIRGLEEAIAKEKRREGRQSWLNDLVKRPASESQTYRDETERIKKLNIENHPFFDKKEND